MRFISNLSREEAEEKVLEDGHPIIRHSSCNLPNIYAITYMLKGRVCNSLFEWDLFQTGTCRAVRVDEKYIQYISNTVYSSIQDLMNEIEKLK